MAYFCLEYCTLYSVFDQKPRPADNFKKCKIKHIPKNNVILKTQDMSQWRDDILVETVIFGIYFKVILIHDFEIKSKYHSFNQNFVFPLTHILSFQDDVILRNMFYLIFIQYRLESVQFFK